ncbi:MAG: NapC/NirT cytochrome c family, N-terminal region, partial [Acidobacteria bacterium]|nr:NapC/NirT cytochrome c family, N-terminal region [Acidobacteriota bacterium]
MSMSKWKKAIIIVVIFAGFALAGSAAFWHYAGPSQTCSSCHEIRSAQDLWEASYHREVPC